jgi:hypothetical protein
MKHLVVLMGLALLSLGACKKDKPVVVGKNFADYTFDDIKAQVGNFTSNLITFNAPNTNFTAGSIIFFKTSLGNFGKMEVVSVDANKILTVNIVVYNTSANGSQLYQKNNFSIPANIYFSYDLDDSTVPETGNTDISKSDFTWGQSNSIYSLIPVDSNNAKAMLFKP